MHHRLSTSRALGYVVVAGLAWGTGGPTGALLSQYAGLSPLATSFWRLAAAAAWLALARLVVPSAAPVMVAGGPLRSVFSGVGLAVCQVGYFLAIPRVGVGIATVIALGTAPVLIAVATRERVTVSTSATTCAAVVGLVLLTAATDGSGDLLGIAAAVLSAAGYSLTTLLNRNTPDPITTAFVGFVVGAVLLLPFAALPSTALGWLLIGYFGLVPTALAYTLFYAGLRTLSASTASVIALLEPVVAAAIGVFALGEHLTPAALAGAAIVLVAIAVRAGS
jgi:DME family drug/metabolite transporter